MKQQEIYSSSEANNWFARNKEALLERQANNNQVAKILKSYDFQPTCILDLGCSNGYFLHQLKSELNCDAYGVDLSEDAISDGKKRYPEVNLFHKSASDLSLFEDEKFDFVNVSGL